MTSISYTLLVDTPLLTEMRSPPPPSPTIHNDVSNVTTAAIRAISQQTSPNPMPPSLSSGTSNSRGSDASMDSNRNSDTSRTTNSEIPSPKSSVSTLSSRSSNLSDGPSTPLSRQFEMQASQMSTSRPSQNLSSTPACSSNRGSSIPVNTCSRHSKASNETIAPAAVKDIEESKVPPAQTSTDDTAEEVPLSFRGSMRVVLASDDDLANLQMATSKEHFNFGEPAEIDRCLDLPDQIRAIVLAQNLTCNNARHLFGRTLNKNEVISSKIERMFDIPREHMRTFALSLGTARYLDFSYFAKAGKAGFTDAVITHLQDKINELEDKEKNRFENITIQLLAGCAAFEIRKCKTRKTLAKFFLRETPSVFCKETVARLSRATFMHWPKKVEESMSEAKKTIKKKWKA